MKHLHPISPVWHVLLVCILLVFLPAKAQNPAEVVLYDNWLQAATCRLEADSLDGQPRFTLAVTYDEGRIQVPMGSTLQFTLRGGTAVKLTTDREVDRRRDVRKRRYRNRTDYYITCYYPISLEQLAQLAAHEVTRLRVMTSTGWLERKATNRKASITLAQQAQQFTGKPWE